MAVLAAFISLIVSFVRKDFILLTWKEAWFLLLPRNNNSRGHVT